MPGYGFGGTFKSDSSDVVVNLTLISFVEEGVNILYSPSVDLSGYGKTESEAQSSFEEALEEFLRYTTTKGTFEEELKKLGWKFSGGKRSRKFRQPFLNELVTKNDYLSNLINEKDFQKVNKEFSVPALV